MKYVWTIVLISCLTTTLFACQAAETSRPVSEEPALPTDSSEASPASNLTPSLSPTLSQEEATMVPVTPPNEAAETLVTLVKQHLAQRLKIAVDQIALSDIKPIVWRDAGLGCPKPGVDYIQVETPGYNILLDVEGKTYRYHTDETKRFVPCNK